MITRSRLVAANTTDNSFRNVKSSDIKDVLR